MQNLQGIVRIDFIPFGEVNGTACASAEEKVNKMLAKGRGLISITPFVIATSGMPTVRGNQLLTTPPQIRPGLVVITLEPTSEE